MKNAFWYLLLCLLSICIFGYSLWKKRDVKLVVLYFFISGLTYVFEYVVLVLFDAYVYYPKFLPIDYFDNILGAVASDAFTVPMASVFVAAFELPYKRYLIIVAAIFGIEWLFLNLGVYQHYWWSIIYTGIGLITVFIIAKKWLTVLHQCMNRYTRFVTLYFTSVVLHASLVFILAGILNMYIYRIQWFENPYRSHIAFSTVYIFIQSFVFSFLSTSKFKWINVIIWISIPTGFDFLFIESNILAFLRNWNIFYFILMRLFILSILFFIDRYILKSSKDIAA